MELVEGSKLERTLSRSQRGVAYSQRTPRFRSVIGIDQRPVVRAAVLGDLHGVGGRVEVREDIVALPARRGILPTHPKIQGEFGADAEIVLEIEEVLALPVVAHQVVGQLDL